MARRAYLGGEPSACGSAKVAAPDAFDQSLYGSICPDLSWCLCAAEHANFR